MLKTIRIENARKSRGTPLHRSRLVGRSGGKADLNQLVDSDQTVLQAKVEEWSPACNFMQKFNPR